MNQASRVPLSRPFSPTLRQLRAFVAVYQLRKLSAAAQQLYLTQSAISVLIRQLEDGLGTRLFDRTTRALKPTAAAQEAIVMAERILRDLDALGQGLQELGSLRRGRLSVAITPTLAEILLPPVVRAFHAQHPAIQLVIDDCAPDQFLARIQSERVDFGIGTPEGPCPGLLQQTLVRDHLSLVCAADHPLAQKKQVRWKDLADVPVTTVQPGYGIRALIEHSAIRAGVTLDVAHEVAFLSTALWMCASGMGPIIMPAAYATAAREPGLQVRALHGPKVSRDISIVSRQGHTLSAAAQAFIALLRASTRTAARRAEPGVPRLNTRG